MMGMENGSACYPNQDLKDVEGCERDRTHIFGAVEGTKLLKIVLTVFSP